MSWSALFLCGLFGDRWVEKWIRTDDVFETGRVRRGWVFSEDFETDFGLKQNGELWGLQGVMGEIVGNLLEKYCFGTDLGFRSGREGLVGCKNKNKKYFIKFIDKTFIL